MRPAIVIHPSLEKLAAAAAGAGKKLVLAEVFRAGLHRPRLPAELVSPTDGELEWCVDEEAAGNLGKPWGSDEQDDE